ncbi:TPA: hypothetical protein ACSKKX_002596 [Listeria innocua]
MKNNLFDVVGMVLMLGITVLMEIYFSALFRLNVLMDNYIGGHYLWMHLGFANGGRI